MIGLLQAWGSFCKVSTSYAADIHNPTLIMIICLIIWFVPSIQSNKFFLLLQEVGNSFFLEIFYSSWKLFLLLGNSSFFKEILYSSWNFCILLGINRPCTVWPKFSEADQMNGPYAWLRRFTEFVQSMNVLPLLDVQIIPWSEQKIMKNWTNSSSKETLEFSSMQLSIWNELTEEVVSVLELPPPNQRD